jgi:hypothetical protein
MPRPRPKTRVDHVANACTAFQAAAAALHEVDLRKVRGDLRDALAEAREYAEWGVSLTTDALQLDAPARAS